MGERSKEFFFFFLFFFVFVMEDVKGELGMPANPTKCCGKKVRLNPMNEIQKWVLPMASLYILPVHLGSQ